MTSVLLVCTGNIFRSMTAEYALRGNLTAASEIVVSSAGIMHAPQARARSDVVEYLSGRGIDVSGHQRRTLSKQMVDSTDLVVAMNVDHKSRLLAEFGVESPLFMEMAGRGEMQLPDVDDLFPVEQRFGAAAQRHIFSIIDEVVDAAPAVVQFIETSLIHLSPRDESQTRHP